MINKDFKTRLHEHCKQILEQRIAVYEKAMSDAQQSANEEEKSSAGDKYETGRAMSQIQRDMSAKQLQTCLFELAQLNKINPAQTLSFATKGALIQTNLNIIYIATAIGIIEFENLKIAVISPNSPLALLLAGKKINDQFLTSGGAQTLIYMV